MNELSTLYAHRFEAIGLEKRQRVWKVLCTGYFDRRMVRDGSVLEVACGYGEFINNIDVRQKYAIDLNPSTRPHLAKDVTYELTPADQLGFIPDNTLDRVFTSNFLEHLPSKAACSAVLKEVLRVLKPGGKFIILGPNMRYLYDKYWDFYDHFLPLSHVSLAEGLLLNGFAVEEVIDRFLPYTMQSRLPSSDALVRLYLASPWVWRFLGKQFLLTARKPGV
jgi:SAM-dependent methyltransferase